ncbi:MAG: ribosome recycling factor [Planctomycetota bacterium]
MAFDKIVSEAEERMEKAREVFHNELRSMRTGRAHPGLVEGVRVDYYGNSTPLKQIATISAPEPDLILVKPFDPASLKDLEKGILKSDVGLTPSNDGKVLRLKVPPLSEERRKQLVGRAKEVAEEARVSVRNIRRDANKAADQLQKDGALTEDEQTRAKDAIQELTKRVEKMVDDELKRKTEELLEV